MNKNVGTKQDSLSGRDPESGYIPFHPVYFHFVTNRADIDIFRRMVSI